MIADNKKVRVCPGCGKRYKDLNVTTCLKCGMVTREESTIINKGPPSGGSLNTKNAPTR